MLESINKIQALLIVLDKKVDSLMHRSFSEPEPSPKPVESARPKERVMYKAICADCRKECSVPFKPSGDRPVYCQDCFSRRKVINMSGMKVNDKPLETVSLAKQPVKEKKVVAAKKPVGKKKSAPKKK